MKTLVLVAVLTLAAAATVSPVSAQLWYDCDGPGSMQDTPCTEEQGEENAQKGGKAPIGVVKQGGCYMIVMGQEC